MTRDGRWCCQTICGRPDIARVIQLLEDGVLRREVARRLHLPPGVVSRLWRSYQETGQYTMRQGQGRSRVTTPQQDRSIILLYRHNHISAAKALEIDLFSSTEVHFTD